MAIETYAKNDQTQVSQHFRLAEFHCKGKDCNCKETLLDQELLAYLQQIRDHFGKPVRINSAYRCKTHNAAVGGVSHSLHTKGQAADICITGVEPAQIAAYAESIGILGIGLYEAEDGNFVHIDTRKSKSYWYGHAQAYRETFGGKKQAGVYLVTCRVNGRYGVHTLVFDGSVGNCTQQLGNHYVSVKMDGDGVFSVVSIGRDQAEILHVRKL